MDTYIILLLNYLHNPTLHEHYEFSLTISDAGILIITLKCFSLSARVFDERFDTLLNFQLSSPKALDHNHLPRYIYK